MNIYCYGYPKSGNTWIKYICLTLLGMPFNNVHTHPDEPPYFKTHFKPEDIQPDDLLITPVRNYKECIVSFREHDGINDQMFIDAVINTPPGQMSYVDPLLFYMGWTGFKLMITYEGLIESPEFYIDFIAHVFKKKFKFIPGKELHGLKTHYETHRKTCLVHYNGDAKESKTHGEKTEYHKFKLTEYQRKRWDNMFQEYHPTIYDAYLSHYAEDEKQIEWNAKTIDYK